VPAAAVIPAPIAYIKVVAVKKLVVEFWNGREGGSEGFRPSRFRLSLRAAPVRPEGRALVRAFPPTGRSLLLFVEWEYSPEGRFPFLLSSERGKKGRSFRQKNRSFGPLGVSTGPEGFLDGGFSLPVVFSFFHRFRSELRFVYLE
jgi:hypothetical protein